MSQHRRTQKPQLQRRQQELAFPSPLCSTPAHKVLGDASPPGDGELGFRRAGREQTTGPQPLTWALCNTHLLPEPDPGKEPRSSPKCQKCSPALTGGDEPAPGIGCTEYSFIHSFTHSLNKSSWDFPGGLVVKNLPVNAEDTGSIPGLGRFHMLQATKPMHHNY